jgi:uncharacterized protein involved in exopolysaccharide biosynthesis
MNSQDHEPNATGADKSAQTLYLVPIREEDEGLDIAKTLFHLWRRKWQVFLVALAFGVLGGMYAFLVTPIYKASVVLTPARVDATSGIRARLGGLASLAGIAMGPSSSDRTDAIALLRSRALIEEFIQENDLLAVLFPRKWDASAKRWKSDDPKEQPDVRKGVKLFVENIRTIEEDIATGLITLTIEWKDPEAAAAWVEDLVSRVNNRLRERDLAESESRLRYLNAQLETTASVELRQAIARLIEEEIQTIMLAKAGDEYAFKVIDPVRVPHEPAWPKRSLIVVLALFVGGIAGAILVLFQAQISGSRE